MAQNTKTTNMPEMFVDTAGWAHLVDVSQPFHTEAAFLYRQATHQGQKLITTNYIITELVALLTSPFRLPRPAIIQFVQGIRNSPHVEIVHVDSGLDEEAWQLLTNRLDKSWSLVDCSSFVIMKQRAILEALTSDHHFEQAGFVRLLKP